MASSQQASNKQHATQLNDNEKAKLANALKQAKTFYASHPTAKASQQELAKIVGILTNEESREIGLLKSHSYKGDFEADPPKTIAANDGTGAFVARGASMDGDLHVLVGPKGAIIYGNIDEPNKLFKYGWLVAYHMHADSTAPTVYVEAGFKDKLMNMNWEEIENKLDTLGRPTSRYWDSDSGAAAVAQIHKDGNNLSFLGANFEVRNN